MPPFWNAFAWVPPLCSLVHWFTQHLSTMSSSRHVWTWSQHVLGMANASALIGPLPSHPLYCHDYSVGFAIRRKCTLSPGLLAGIFLYFLIFNPHVLGVLLFHLFDESPWSAALKWSAQGWFPGLLVAISRVTGRAMVYMHFLYSGICSEHIHFLFASLKNIQFLFVLYRKCLSCNPSPPVHSGVVLLPF